MGVINMEWSGVIATLILIGITAVIAVVANRID